MILFILAPAARAEVEGFVLQDGDELVVQCPTPRAARPVQPKRIKDVELCPYENTECEVGSKKKQIFFKGTVTIRCPSINGSCPTLQKCASDKFTVAQRDSLLEDVSPSNDPNLMAPSGSGFVDPTGPRRFRIPGGR